MSEKYDLLGDPIPENFGKRGRPPHIPTQENRNRVRLLLGLDWDIERIAKSLRITKPTLRKHYFSELKHQDEARHQVEAVHLEMLWDQCKAGNVAAIKEWRRMMDRAQQEEADRKLRQDQAPPGPRKAAPLGKKEAADQDAQSAGLGTEWGEDLLGKHTTH